MSSTRWISALVIAASLTLSAIGCSTSPSVKSSHDFNPAVDFRGYTTYAFISERPMIVGQTQGIVSPMLESRLMESIRVAMNAKGYSELKNPESANLAISFTVGSRDQIKVDSYPASFQTGWGGRGAYYGYGYNTETRVRQYTEGQMAVDVFDVATHNPAYHGTASTKVSNSDRENQQPLLDAVAAAALSALPLAMSGVAPAR